MQAPLDTEQQVLEDPEALAALLAELEASKKRAEALRSQSAKWQQTLNDGAQDLTADLDHDLRMRVRTIVTEAESVLDDHDPIDIWDGFEQWLHQRIAFDLASHHQTMAARADALAARVADHFAADEAAVGMHVELPVTPIRSRTIGTDLGLMAPWELLRYNRQIWQLDTTVTTLNPEFRYDKAIKRYFKSRAKRMIRNTVRKPQSGEGAGNLIELINDLPHDLTDLRYKLMSNIRRGEHAFRHSLSKASYVGKLVFDHLLALGFGATLALLGARVVFGRDPLNEWLRATLWPALPWWAWLLAAVYATSVIQRLRLRFTEIDVKRN